MQTRTQKLPFAFNIDAVVPYVATIVLVVCGSFFFPKLASFGYLLQQLQIASILGVIALGAMLVILLGHIDLSVPWVFTGAAIISTTLVGSEHAILSPLAIPIGILFGMLCGVINGVGVAIFRIPAMVWTLAINSMVFGLAVLNTGGFNPKGQASELMIYLASGTVLSIPVAFVFWMALGLVLAYFLYANRFGKYLSAIGFNEKATYLSGVSTPAVVFSAFIIAGACSAMGGILLAGYANQAYQSMGDPYLMPTITAVVIGGTSILGGRGTLVGTIGGVIFITILTSILSVMQISEAWRNIIFGLIIIAMLLFQSLRRKRS